jgi:hypothetical protein
MSTLFLINDIIKFKNENIHERILWIDNNNDKCFTIELFVDRLNIKIRRIAELNSHLEQDALQIMVDYPISCMKDINELKKSEIELMDKAFEIVSYIANIDREPQCFINHYRRALVLKAVGQFNVSEKAIYKYLRLFWQGGRLKSSLVPKFSNCGGKGKTKKTEGKKLGKPNSLSYITGKNEGINVNEEIRKIFDTALKRYYLHQTKRSLPEVYRYMIKDFFSKTEFVNGEIIRKPRPTTDIPTLRQFKYWFYKNRDVENVIKKREGEKKFALNYRQLNSDSTQEAFAPGFRYQVDATVADIYLVSRIDKSSVIGRPVIYLAVDVFSRMIAGVHVCLEGPNWNGMASLIYNCMENKVVYCKRFGITIKHEDWPVEGIPQVILGDRGELVGPVGESAIDNLSIVVENAPSGRGDAKGIVEQNFNIINTKLKSWLPGAVKKEYREGRKLRYIDEARLDINEFTKIIIINILNRNKRIMQKYPITQEMIDAGIKINPLGIWEWGMKNRAGKLRRLPDELLRIHLMKRDKAIITESGIKFAQMKYSCLGIPNSSFIDARIYGGSTVDIIYDSRDISVIYYIDKVNNKFLPCYLKEENIVFINKTYEEVLDFHFIKSADNIEKTYEENLNNLETDTMVEEILKQNKDKNIEIHKKSRAQIKYNKKKENEIYSKSQALSNKGLLPESNDYMGKQEIERAKQQISNSRTLQRLLDRKKESEIVGR